MLACAIEHIVVVRWSGVQPTGVAARQLRPGTIGRVRYVYAAIPQRVYHRSCGSVSIGECSRIDATRYRRLRCPIVRAGNGICCSVHNPLDAKEALDPSVVAVQWIIQVVFACNWADNRTIPRIVGTIDREQVMSVNRSCLVAQYTTNWACV